MRFFNFILLFLIFIPFSISAQSDKFKIVLDAGHGGKDPGAISGKVHEKDIVLSVSLLVGKALESDPEYSVVYTRKSDKFIGLYERGDIANKAKADLFISIHCNSISKSQIMGVETFVLGLNANDRNFEVAKKENSVIHLEDNYQSKYANYDINSPESFIGISIMQEEFLEQSIKMAKKVQNIFSKQLGRIDRGVKQAAFIVLHQTYMPSILIELGFLTNVEERNYLSSKKGQQEIADNLVKAIKSYRNWIKNNSSLPIESVENVEDVIYKIQIATSSKNIPAKSQNFKGLSPISKESVDKLFRYYFGKETNLHKAQKLLEKAKKKGYKDAFIVPYIAGKRSTMEDLQK